MFEQLGIKFKKLPGIKTFDAQIDIVRLSLSFREEPKTITDETLYFFAH
jgi:hypothetical protein